MKIAVALVLLLALLAGCACAGNIKGAMILGDSILDVGTNTYIFSEAACNYEPYGQKEFGPVGRCSNGRLIPDIILSKLDLPLAEPFIKSIKNINFTKDVPFIEDIQFIEEVPSTLDFASGMSGLLDTTNREMKLFPFSMQVMHLKGTASIVGSKKMKDTLVLIGTGGDDLYAAYSEGNLKHDWFDLSKDTGNMVIVDRMIEAFSRQLKDMYDAGVRKMVVMGLPPVGCIPFLRDIEFKGCSEKLNRAVANFNKVLEEKVLSFATNETGLKIAFADVGKIVGEVMASPGKFGFEEIEKPCCPFCLPRQWSALTQHNHNLCTDASKYLFWDSFHLSEAGYNVVANALLAGDTTVMRPFNIYQLDGRAPAPSPSPPTPAPPPKHHGNGASSTAGSSMLAAVLLLAAVVV